MKTTLKRNLPVTRAALFAELAVLELRPELGHLCRAVDAPTEPGAATRMSPEVVRSALPGVSAAGAEQIVAYGGDLDLWSRDGRLTELGHACAEDDHAPVPEQGTYGLWLVEDPLLGGCRPLGIERAEDPQHKAPRQSDLETLYIHPPLNQTLVLREPGETRIVLRALPTHDGRLPALFLDTRAHCDLQLHLDFDDEIAQWWLEGQLDRTSGADQRKPLPRPLHGLTTPVELDLDALLAAWGRGPLAEFGRWDHEIRRLAVTRTDLPETAQGRFLHDLVLRAAEVSGYGPFVEVTLEDVPVGPADKAAAEEWADALLVRALVAEPFYRSVEQVQLLFMKIVEDTPLTDFDVAPPRHEDLLESPDLNLDVDVFWSFAAPADLVP